MADRGRKAYPVSSPVLDEWWQEHCMKLHKQRLQAVTAVIDQQPPKASKVKLNGAKKEMKRAEKQHDIDHANEILLGKLIRIKEFDSSKVFRPWMARSTFQYGPGLYIDPSTGTKCVDHLNLTAGLSPRSIHCVRPSTAPSHRQQMQYLEIVDQNTKLLRTIEATKSVYGLEVLEREAMQHAQHSRRLSNFRGPESARYNPVVSPHASLELQAQAEAVAAARSKRPYSAQLTSLEPKEKQYTPVQRRTASAPRRVGESDYGWSLGPGAPAPGGASTPQTRPGAARRHAPPVAPSARASSAHHRAELAELGVVDENDDEELMYDDTPSTGRMVIPTTQARAGSAGSMRPTSARPGSASQQINTAAVAAAWAGAAPAPPTTANTSRPGSAGSVRSAASASRNNAPLSPYLQPISRQQSARSGSASSRPGSRQGSQRFEQVNTLASQAGWAAEASAASVGSGSAASKAVSRTGSAHSAPAEEATVAAPQSKSEKSWASSAASGEAEASEAEASDETEGKRAIEVASASVASAGHSEHSAADSGATQTVNAVDSAASQPEHSAESSEQPASAEGSEPSEQPASAEGSGPSEQVNDSVTAVEAAGDSVTTVEEASDSVAATEEAGGSEAAIDNACASVASAAAEPEADQRGSDVAASDVTTGAGVDMTPETAQGQQEAEDAVAGSGEEEQEEEQEEEGLSHAPSESLANIAIPDDDEEEEEEPAGGSQDAAGESEEPVSGRADELTGSDAGAESPDACDSGRSAEVGGTRSIDEPASARGSEAGDASGVEEQQEEVEEPDHGDMDGVPTELPADQEDD